MMENCEWCKLSEIDRRAAQGESFVSSFAMPCWGRVFIYSEKKPGGASAPPGKSFILGSASVQPFRPCGYG
jgi:hypothetical protein